MRVLIIGFLCISCNVFAQTNEKRGTVKVKKENDTTIYQEKVVDQKPQFPGGTQSEMKYFSKLCNQSSTVTFVVEKNGRISFVKIVNGAKKKECDQETIKVLKLMPLWVPGNIKGKPVRVRMEMEFNEEDDF
jgi:hypothetical protein